MRINSFEDVGKYVEENSLKIDIQASYSLDRIKKILRKLNNPQDKIKIVHVAGTSGKTSTCYYLTKLLILNGYKTGLTISPHLESINERVQVDLTPISEKEFCENLDEFIKILKSINAELTYFELLVAFAFWYFAKINVDYAVVEVGLGGLFDGTNVVSREDKMCVITDIGMDHTEILGNTIEKIVKQKAGIIQEGNKVFCNQQDDEIIDQLKKTTSSKNAKIFINPENNFTSFAERNFSLAALTARSIFDMDSKPTLNNQQLKEAQMIEIPGRMERYYVKGKTIILDGAHNSQKIENLLQSLKGEVETGNYCFVLAVGENKSSQLLEMSQAISQYASRIILTGFESSQDFKHKSLSPGYLKSYFEEVPTEKAADLDDAIEQALACPESTVVFTGSLYMVGPVRSKLKMLKV